MLFINCLQRSIKIFPIIFIFFFGILQIQAISINLSDKLDIGPILGSGSFDGDENFNIDNQVLYSDIHRDYSNTTAFKCLEKNGEKCLLGTWNTTVFYLFNLNKEGSEKYSFSAFFDSSIGYSLVYNNDLQTRKIFLRIGNNNKELLDLTNLQSCGNDNPNLCLFAFNFSGFYLNKSGFSGVYLRLVDTYDYGDLSNVSMNRLFLDRTDSNKSEESIFSRFWRGYTEWFNGYDGGYGARVSDLRYGVISLGKGYNGDNFYNYCISDDGYFNELVDNQAYYHCSNYRTGLFKGKVKMLTSIGGIEANILNYTDVVICDFLAGNRDHLKRTIKDVIGDFNIKGIVSGTGSSSNPENWGSGSFSNPGTLKDRFFGNAELTECSVLNIFCHISNFIKGFFGAIGRIFSPIIDLFNFLKTNIEDLSKISFSGNLETCKSFDDSNIKTGTIASKLINLISITIPFAPQNGAKICTFEGEKIVNYKQNTNFLDTIIILFCFSSIIFSFIPNNKE